MKKYSNIACLVVGIQTIAKRRNPMVGYTFLESRDWCVERILCFFSSFRETFCDKEAYSGFSMGDVCLYAFKPTYLVDPCRNIVVKLGES